MDARKLIGLRLQRADEHADQVVRILSDHRTDRPHQLKRVEDEAVGTVSFLLRRFEPIPLRAGIVFGDAIHGLRAALDNAVWALRDESVTDHKKLARIALPVHNSEQAWLTWAGQVRGALPTGVMDYLSTLQPFRGYDKHGRLQQLNTLWMMDKHRTPEFAFRTNLGQMGFRHGDGVDIDVRTGPFSGGDTVAVARGVAGTVPDVEVIGEPEFYAAIRVNDDKIDWPVRYVLRRLQGYVRDDVVPTLLGFL